MISISLRMSCLKIHHAALKELSAASLCCKEHPEERRQLHIPWEHLKQPCSTPLKSVSPRLAPAHPPSCASRAVKTAAPCRGGSHRALPTIVALDQILLSEVSNSLSTCALETWLSHRATSRLGLQVSDFMERKRIHPDMTFVLRGHVYHVLAESCLPGPFGQPRPETWRSSGTACRGAAEADQPRYRTSVNPSQWMSVPRLWVKTGGPTGWPQKLNRMNYQGDQPAYCLGLQLLAHSQVESVEVPKTIKDPMQNE